jgi:hypothetical protein
VRLESFRRPVNLTALDHPKSAAACSVVLGGAASLVASRSNRRGYRHMVFFISNEGRSILLTHASR